MQLFLDANAHLPINKKAMDALINFNASIGGHGHAMAYSKPGREAAAKLEDARAKIAKLIGATSSHQIIFTSTCTQACEWGLEILKSRNYQKVYSSTIEHPAVSQKVYQLFGSDNLFVSKDGIINCTFDPGNNSAIVCIHIHNEIGTIQDINNIKVPFFSDMSQSLGKIPINVSRIPNLKLAVFGAHKFGGPANVGILYIQDTDWWQEFGSGSRYYFDRAGTPDVGSIVATSVALEDSIRTMSKRYENAIRFSNILDNELDSIGVKVIAKDNKIPYTSFIKVGKKIGPYLVSQLESYNIYIGLGSACGSMHTSSSPVMNALGESGLSHDYIRISQWGDYGEQEAKYVVNTLKKYCKK